MATENQEVVEQTTTSEDEQQTQTESQTTEVNVESAEAKIAELQAALEKQQEIVDKARKGEKYQKHQRDAEVSKYQKLYEAEKARAESLEQEKRNSKADGVIRQALGESGAKAVDTALKLVDRSAVKFGEDGDVDVDSIKAAVEVLKGSDPILFGADQESEQPTKKPAAPPAVRATESDRVSGYAAEIKTCKSMDEIQQVMRKYGKA